jgi:hypothetical protein
MNFTDKIIGTINNPKNTMKGIAEKPMIEEALMIVGIYAIIGAFSGYIQSSKIDFDFEGFPGIPDSMESIMMVTTVLSALLGIFVIWFVGTGIIHLVSMALGGEGKFYPQMMTIVGYSMIPILFGSAMGLLLISMMEPITITVSATNPTASNEIYKNPYLLASGIIGTLMQIWASIILFFGLLNAHKLTPSKSAVVAVIPIAVSVILLALNLWNIGFG